MIVTEASYDGYLYQRRVVAEELRQRYGVSLA
jgi:hypothetical protein